MSTPGANDGSWDLAALLAEPRRRAVFDAVRKARTPVTRDEVAESTGINRRLTSFHLDRLAEAGLLQTDYARPPGRSGPGAGRPAKRYAAAPVQLDLTVPSRHYEFAAGLLTRAIAAAPGDAARAAKAAAFEEGRRIGRLRRPAGRRSAGRDRAALREALIELGFEPAFADSGILRLCNCPFRSLADLAPSLICGLNHQLLQGLLDGLAQDQDRASLTPDPPNCCVTITTK